MDYKELMYKSLNKLLRKQETLHFPIYGTLLQGKAYYFGYFGFTENYLLIALLHKTQKKIDWVTRVPLDIKKVQIKRSLIPGQYIIRIDFNEGDPCKIKVSKKVVGIDCQEENLNQFMTYLKEQYSK